MKPEMGAADFAGKPVTAHLNDPQTRALVEVIREGLLKDGQVRLHNFGTFRIKWTRAHRIVHPRTGESMVAPAHPKVVFVPARSLREAVEPNPRPVLPIYDNPDAVAGGVVGTMVTPATQSLESGDAPDVAVSLESQAAAVPIQDNEAEPDSRLTEAVVVERELIERQPQNGLKWAVLGITALALIPAILYLLQKDVDEQGVAAPAALAEQAADAETEAAPVLADAAELPAMDAGEASADEAAPDPVAAQALPMADGFRDTAEPLTAADESATAPAAPDMATNRTGGQVSEDAMAAAQKPDLATAPDMAMNGAGGQASEDARAAAQKSDLASAAKVTTNSAGNPAPVAAAPAQRPRPASAPVTAMNTDTTPGSDSPQVSSPAQTLAPAPASSTAGQPVPAALVREDGASSAIASTPRRAAPLESPGAPAVTSVAPGEQRVRAGDSLWNLARRLYGDGSLWPVIYAANGEQLSNPDLLLPGQLLHIPARDSADTPAFRGRVAAGYFKAYQYHLSVSSSDAEVWLIAAVRWDRAFVRTRAGSVPAEHQKFI